MSSPPPLTRAHPSTSSVWPHRENAVVSHVTIDGSAEATTAYFDYPEPEAFIHHLSAAPPSSPPTSRTSSVSSRRSWWKHPSIYWGIVLSSIQMFTLAMQSAPSIEIFNRMACQVIRPDIRIEHVRYPAWRDDPPIIPSPPLPLPMPMPMPMMTLNFFTDDFMVSGGLGGMMNPNQTQSPTKGQLCLKDPRVQETVASLVTVLSVISGTLTLFVSAWWGQRADLWGRTTVISVSALATLIHDVSVITCTYFSQQLPGKAYWWFIPGTVLVGILGGMASGVAAERAYLSDCAEPTSRAAVFAFQAGMGMGGMAIAPIVGAQLVRLSGDLLSVYYLAFVVDLMLLALWFFAVPESLSYSTRASNQKQWEEDRRARLEAASQRTATTRLGRFAQLMRANPVIDLFKPLSVLFPAYKDEDDHSLGRDWNMTVLGATFLILSISSGAAPFLMQLSQVLWGWGNEMVGYWLSVLGASRAIYLLFIFPPVVRFFKPKPAAIALEGPESQLHSNATETSLPSNAEVPSDAEVEMEVPKPPPVPSFDLLVARISLGLDVIAWCFVAASQTPGHWLLSTAGLAIGSALTPTVMSLALALYPNGDAEAGKLFGAFSVLTTLGAEICGQLIFGAIFKASVGVFPRLIVVVAAAALFVAFIMLFFIRLPKPLRPVPGVA
ncbi:MFS general substrate transporter [Exidia glandulosa HHB12029]|uniref:MFS general substrate transporter n=1 Tax=Exidia glandulosa HHB12029 TaxID=1314781 RepID=A0A165EIA2_EXIGL|nr:MFS general substrate transporter [Exidia glandulosa HHB12029]